MRLNTPMIAPRTSVDQEVGQNLFAPSNFYAASGNWTRKPFSVAADRYKILMPNDGGVKIASSIYGWTGQPILDLSDGSFWDTVAGTDGTVAANRAGKEIYAYLVPPTDGTTAPKPLFSLNASAPYGYTTTDSRLVAFFHGLCVAVNHETTLTAWAADTVMVVRKTVRPTVWNGKILRCSAVANDSKTSPTTEPDTTNATVGSVIVDDQVTWVVEQHGLEGYVAGDIIPASVGDIKHRPTCNIGGMVQLPGMATWESIYLPSGATGAFIYGGTILHNVNQFQGEFLLKTLGQRFGSLTEWMNGAVGSNWTPLNGGSDPLTTGGLSDAYGRRAVSDIGVEDAAGSHHQYVLMVGAGNIWAAGGHFGIADPGPQYLTSLPPTTVGIALTYRGFCDGYSSS